MKVFVINISTDDDELEYHDEIEGKDFESVEPAIQAIANNLSSTLYVCEEGTDRWHEVEPESEE